ncbi:MAG TPA: phenylalanine--tRNA ligase subunit beta [Gemmatimonadaceae bacterium]
MKISHDWLRAFVPHALTPQAASELLSDHTVTLDGIAPLRADLMPIVVARVVESEKIPETKLSFNKVDDGSGTLLEVVCGAPNVTVGALYPFARTGTVMPAGLTIEKRKIRGFTSNGMLCSARELGLGDDHEGILALDVDVPPGTPLLSAMPIGDVQLDLDVLPNRPDLLSHLGVARELSALTGVMIETPVELRSAATIPAATAGTASAAAHGVRVSVEDPAGAPLYIAVVIRGVKVAPSPDWLRARVESVGSRSIGNVVDATNYVLHGLGQPVHAFDLAKLAQSAIVVRKAKSGESLVTLDGVVRTLEPWMTIIADGARAAALAGVMGGQGSEVTEATTDVLLEVAYFAPRDVRKVRRAFGLSTDASYRFERGVDSGATAEVAEFAARLIVSVAGGAIESVLEVGAAPPPPAAVRLRPRRVEQLLGVHVAEEEIERLLASVGFSGEPGADRSYSVRPPTWRHDVAHEVDLVEEIARLRGYHTLPDDLRPYRIGTVPDHPLQLAGRRVRDALVAAGLAETRPMPFTKGDGTPRARVTNPLAEDEPFLRTSLLDTLARRAEFNLNQHEGNVRLFEIGSAFMPGAEALPHEEVRAAALVMGMRRPAHFTDSKPPAFDVWDAKSLAETMARAAFPGEKIALLAGEDGELWSVCRLEAADGPEVGPEAANGSHDETLTVRLLRVGTARAVPLDAPVWASPAFGVEITLGPMPSAPVADRGRHDYASAAEVPPLHFARFTALPTTPAAEFDLALIVPDDRLAADVERVIRRASGEMLERLELFDEFRGAGVPVGNRSLAWRLTFRHPERTLRDKEIDGRRSQLLKTLEKELGVVARTA